MKLFYQILGLISVVSITIAILKILGVSDTPMLIASIIGCGAYILTQINRG